MHKLAKRNLSQGVAAAPFLTALLLSQPVGAQTAPPGAAPPAATSATTPTNSGLQDIVVTARKSAERLQAIPVSVTALSSASLVQQNIKDTIAISKVTPGLFAIPGSLSSSEIYFNIRGQAGSAFGDSAVGVYVDNVYRQSQGGMNGTLVDLERVEVLKGPQGTLYGKNTTGGVVNIITKKPELDRFGGYFTLSDGAWVAPGIHGRWNERAEGAINVPIVTDKVALRIAGSYNHDDGYGTEGNGRALQNHNDPYGRAELLIKPGSNWQVLLQGDYGQFRSNGILRPLVEVHPGSLTTAIGVEAGLINPADIPSAANPAGGPTFAPGTTAATAILSEDINRKDFYSEHATNERYSNYNVGGASITVDGDLGDTAHVKSITSYRRWVDRNANDVDGTAYHEFEASFYDNAHFWSQEVNLGGKLFSNKFEWLLGGFFSQYGNERGDVPGVGTQALVSLSGVTSEFASYATTQSLGFFGHGVYHLTDKLSLTGGVRWSKDDRTVIPKDKVLSLDAKTLIACQLPGASTANNCVSPKMAISFDGISYEAAANYQFTHDLMVYATTRKGFRSGDFNTNGNYAPYRPETATDYEIGFKSEWLNHRLLLNVAGYYTDYRDIQRTITVVTTLPGGGFGLQTEIQNAASARIKGVEVELRARPFRGLELSGSYSHTDAAYKKFLDETSPGVFVDRSNEVFGVPPNFANASADYTFGFATGDSLVTHLGVYWQDTVIFGGDIALLPTEKILRQKAYATLDARITYNISAANMSFAIFGRNLTGKEYYAGADDLRTVGVSSMVPGPPRFIGFEVSKRF